jgi:hypothetical protein
VNTPSISVTDENAYEDLLGQWGDLESGLGVILGAPARAQQFVMRVCQYDRWLQALMERDPDLGLYLLFQLAGNSPVGYSASHSLVCAVLCHLIASELKVASADRDSLVRAALTMNIGMTALQDTLANQAEKPSPEQQERIRSHPTRGAMMLSQSGVQDELWLELVGRHHEDTAADVAEFAHTPALRLRRILMVVDRYAAMISPRLSRSGRTASESARSLMAAAPDKADDIGNVLVRAVGLCPPGTFVRLDDDELAVVVRRSRKSNLPFVAILVKANGDSLITPRLHNTAERYPRIHAALPASLVRARLSHHQILQLGALAEQAN